MLSRQTMHAGSTMAPSVSVSPYEPRAVRSEGCVLLASSIPLATTFRLNSFY